MIYQKDKSVIYFEALKSHTRNDTKFSKEASSKYMEGKLSHPLGAPETPKLRKTHEAPTAHAFIGLGASIRKFGEE